MIAKGAPERFAYQVLLILVERQALRQKMGVTALRTGARCAFQLNVGRIQVFTRAHHQAALNDVLQFPHVARPVVCH